MYNKYTISKNNLAIYTGYQYQDDMQGYKVIEVDTVEVGSLHTTKPNTFKLEFCGVVEKLVLMTPT